MLEGGPAHPYNESKNTLELSNFLFSFPRMEGGAAKSYLGCKGNNSTIKKGEERKPWNMTKPPKR